MGDMTAMTSTEREALVAGLLSLSRAFVGETARALSTLGVEVSLPQYRMPVVLAGRGPQRTADLARELSVQPSTVTRKVDRLITKGLVWRGHRAADRRVSWLGLTSAGKELVGTSMRHRRDAIARLVSGVDVAAPDAVAAVLNQLVLAAGEVTDQSWWQCWAASASDVESLP